MSKGIHLRSFALGTCIAISALGLYALAATLNIFKEGDVVSSSKINDNFAALNTDVAAVNAKFPVKTADVADGAVNAAKTSDEPGGAQAVSSSVGSITTADGYDVLLSRAVTAPAPGFVLAIGSGEFCFTKVAAKDVGFGVAVSTAITLTDASEKAFVLPAAASAGEYCTPISVQKIFPVPAGEKTINFIGSKFFTSNPDVQTFDLTLSLVYLPTAYGTVSP